MYHIYIVNPQKVKKRNKSTKWELESKERTKESDSTTKAQRTHWLGDDSSDISASLSNCLDKNIKYYEYIFVVGSACFCLTDWRADRLTAWLCGRPTKKAFSFYNFCFFFFQFLCFCFRKITSAYFIEFVATLTRLWPLLQRDFAGFVATLFALVTFLCH